MRRHHQTDSNHPRQGWNLIEMLLVVSFVGIFGLAAAQQCIQLMQFHTSILSEAAVMLTWEQLGERFRADVANSVSHSIQAVDGTEQLQLELPHGDSVTFTPTPQGLVWSRSRGGRVISQNVYVLPAGKVTFGTDGVSVTLDYQAVGDSNAPRATTHQAIVRLSAIAGWNHRHMNQRVQTERSS